MSGDDVVLPDDVVEYLTAMSVAREDLRLVEDGAGELLEKYGPKPKTLADDRPVLFTRWVENKLGGYWTEAELVVSVAGLPWPDDGGREACELLNDGWRLVPRSDLSARHEVFNPDHLKSRLEPVTITWRQALGGHDTVVLAREISDV